MIRAVLRLRIHVCNRSVERMPAGDHCFIFRHCGGHVQCRNSLNVIAITNARTNPIIHLKIAISAFTGASFAFNSALEASSEMFDMLVLSAVGQCPVSLTSAIMLPTTTTTFRTRAPRTRLIVQRCRSAFSSAIAANISARNVIFRRKLPDIRHTVRLLDGRGQRLSLLFREAGSAQLFGRGKRIQHA